MTILSTLLIDSKCLGPYNDFWQLTQKCTITKTFDNGSHRSYVRIYAISLMKLRFITRVAIFCKRKRCNKYPKISPSIAQAMHYKYIMQKNSVFKPQSVQSAEPVNSFAVKSAQVPFCSRTNQPIVVLHNTKYLNFDQSIVRIVSQDVMFFFF